MSNRAELHRLITALPPLRGRDLHDLVIRPLAGLSNRNYRLDLGGERYVLRLPGPGPRDHARERHNSAIAVELGLCPPVLYENSDGVRLSRHIEGRTLQAHELRDPATRAEPAALLRRLHTSGASFRGRIELFTELDRYRALAAGSLASELDRLCHRVEPLRAALAESRDPPCPCHHDPIADNWLRDSDGRLWLLDWEYAAMGDPLWDLATLAGEAGLDAAGEQALLHAHGGDDRPDRRRRLRQYRGLLDLLAATWALAEWRAGNTATDFGDYARQRLYRAERTLKLHNG